jgi:hypothetical protein
VSELSTEFVLAEEACAIQPKPKGHEPADQNDQQKKKHDLLMKAYAELEQAAGRQTSATRDLKLGVGDKNDQTCQDTARHQHSLYQALNVLDRAALCLSGGGIRSAAFSLGVIQALATHPRPRPERGLFEGNEARAESEPHKPENTVPEARKSLLAQFHFLSTVSGGGYIGSWLSAWRSNASFDTLWTNLVGRPCGPDVEPGTIAWLRAYSNYLTPKLGALSGDTWAGVAIFLRNLLLNWLVMLPAICFVLLLVKMIAVASVGIAVYPPEQWIVTLFAGSGLVYLLFALFFTTHNRPSWRAGRAPTPGKPQGIRQGDFIRWDLLPAALSAGAIIQLSASNSGLSVLLDHHAIFFVIIVAALVGAVIYAASWVAARREWRNCRDFWMWTVSGLVYGSLVGTGTYVYNQAPFDGHWLFNDLLLPVMFGVPWVLLSQMIAEMIFVGLTSSEHHSDEDREWLGRAAGWYLVTAIGWFVVTFLIFAGSLAVTDLTVHVKAWIAPLGGAAGVVTAVVGKSSWSQGPGQESKGSWPISTSLILAITAPIFAAALIILLSGALDEILLNDSLVVLVRFPKLLIFAPGWWLMSIPLLLGVTMTGLAVWAALQVEKVPRFLVLAVVAPIFAAAAIILLSTVTDRWFGPPKVTWWYFASNMTTASSWEMLGPLLLGVAITGIIGWAVKPGDIDTKKFLVAGLAGPAVAVVFILFVAAAIDMFVPPILEAFGHAPLDSIEYPGLLIFGGGWWKIFGPLVFGLVMSGALAWVASRNININRFSLHAIYRNRLVRAFLGASRPKRSADAFTGFDVDDNPHVRKLWPERNDDGTWPQRDPGTWQPFHVINMALNVVSTKRLSWQERKAESFTVSPLHSGSACKAFRRSEEYGGPNGISLGTAMAISGAAASPNMGYNSSPAVTFLLALFNVRLGWWLGNPGPEGERTYRKDGPTLALQPLVEETLGLTTDERPHIYLSDGGHFENLGIYEMVRRRCRYIVAVDAGCDPDYGFEDLGNAVRKIAIDLGVTIRFHGLDKLLKRRKDGRDIGDHKPYHAVGEINYPAADGGGELGTILYIKPGYHGVEDGGIRAYATANPAFPHQGTIDQFFSESQFESYRALGFEITDGILNEALKKLERKDVGLEHIFHYLRTATNPTAAAAHDAHATPTTAGVTA